MKNKIDKEFAFCATPESLGILSRKKEGLGLYYTLEVGTSTNSASNKLVELLNKYHISHSHVRTDAEERNWLVLIKWVLVNLNTIKRDKNKKLIELHWTSRIQITVFQPLIKNIAHKPKLTTPLFRTQHFLFQLLLTSCKSLTKYFFPKKS